MRKLTLAWVQNWRSQADSSSWRERSTWEFWNTSHEVVERRSDKQALRSTKKAWEHACDSKERCVSKHTDEERRSRYCWTLYFGPLVDACRCSGQKETNSQKTKVFRPPNVIGWIHISQSQVITRNNWSNKLDQDPDLDTCSGNASRWRICTVD